VALVHAGRIGKVKRVICQINDAPSGGPFAKSQPVPPGLDWDLWLGQAPKVDYMKERCHWAFRWWYEYSGGKLTDWGAHHVDIAQWAVAPDLPGPSTIDPVQIELTVPFEHGYPTIDNAFNTSPHFDIKCSFANGVDMFLRDRA